MKKDKSVLVAIITAIGALITALGGVTIVYLQNKDATDNQTNTSKSMYNITAELVTEMRIEIGKLRVEVEMMKENYRNLNNRLTIRGSPFRQPASTPEVGSTSVPDLVLDKVEVDSIPKFQEIQKFVVCFLILWLFFHADRTVRRMRPVSAGFCR